MAKKLDTGVIRSVDKIGRLVIPIELRREMGLNTGEPVHMYVQDGKVIVEKYKKKCFICGQGSDTYTSIHGKRICNECKAKLNEVDAVEEFGDEEITEE
jgi:transcriptional pleiotropic regulator of transition state genes